MAEAVELTTQSRPTRGSGKARQLAERGREDRPRALLERMGHSAHFVENGLEALQAVQEHRFDIVLMDVHMPVMDGLTALPLLADEAPVNRYLIERTFPIGALEGLDADTKARVKKMAEQAGVSPDRIIYAAKKPNPHHLARYPLADLLAYAWGGYSAWLDAHADMSAFTPAQLRAVSEAKARADVQANTAKLAGGITAATALVPALNIAGGVIAAVLLAVGEYLPLARGCDFKWYVFTERVIDTPDCGALGEGRTLVSTVPTMYSSLIAQGFDPQARLDEMNAPLSDARVTPAWLLPAAAVVGGAVIGAVIGKVVS